MQRNRTYLTAAVILVLAAGCSGTATTATTVAPATPTSLGSSPTTAVVADTTIPSTTLAPPPTTSSVVADDTVTILISVEGGELLSERRAEVTLGDTVLLTIESDAADEFHLHGYDLTVDVAPGEPAELEFVAEIPGIFEAEFETSHLQVLELVVNQ